MSLDKIPRLAAILVSAGMIIGGLILGIWSFSQITLATNSVVTSNALGQIAEVNRTRVEGRPISPEFPSLSDSISDTVTITMDLSVGLSNVIQVEQSSELPTRYVADTPTPTSVPTATATPAPVSIGLAEGLPVSFSDVVLSQPNVFTAPVSSAAVTLRIDLEEQEKPPIYRQFFAIATQFDTITPEISREELVASWTGETIASDNPYTTVAVLTDTMPTLVTLMGPAGETVQGYASIDEIRSAFKQARSAIALLPFDRLTPHFTVLSLDGANPVDNANKFDSNAYPLVANFYVHGERILPEQRRIVSRLLTQFPASNRRPNRLTVIAMTGVTAMVRQTAKQMDTYGSAWPAEVVGPELASSDLTVISNEVPFVPECETNTSSSNLIFCSKPEYMETLRAVGVDLIGLTGNHQNDYGRADALTSLEIYADEGLPVYGGGKDKEAAYAPHYVEHNGNRLAFLGANSYGPPFAWATDNGPGSARFDLNVMSAMIREIKAGNKADVVLAELQYQETYVVQPLIQQRQDFNALVRAGADIVTGVQSHVPQAMEFTDGKLILYGLGNLFFDQMWTQATRDGLIVKHTIYEGRHISTQVLTTILHDYGQPRWASPADRERILTRVFGASYWE